MAYESDDLPDYPGSDIPALKADFAALDIVAAAIGVEVTNRSIGSFYVAEQKLINIDTKTPNCRGFVSIGQLADEYIHAWNQAMGRGRHLDGDAQAEHRRLGRIAESGGTKALGTHPNRAFHQLEALNFVVSGVQVPPFVWRVPYDALRIFAYDWAQNYR